MQKLLHPSILIVHRLIHRLKQDPYAEKHNKEYYDSAYIPYFVIINFDNLKGLLCKILKKMNKKSEKMAQQLKGM